MYVCPDMHVHIYIYTYRYTYMHISLVPGMLAFFPKVADDRQKQIEGLIE